MAAKRRHKPLRELSAAQRGRYERYAKKIGKTAGRLTQSERQAARGHRQPAGGPGEYKRRLEREEERIEDTGTGLTSEERRKIKNWYASRAREVTKVRREYGREGVSDGAALYARDRARWEQMTWQQFGAFRDTLKGMDTAELFNKFGEGGLKGDDAIDAVNENFVDYVNAEFGLELDANMAFLAMLFRSGPKRSGGGQGGGSGGRGPNMYGRSAGTRGLRGRQGGRRAA